MKISWFALLILALCSCSQKNHAGTTSETENEVAVRVVFPDGNPVGSAQVWLIDVDHYDSLLALGENAHLDSTITDAKGIANLTYDGDVVKVNILAQKPGFAGLARDYDGGDSIITIDSSSQVSGTANLAVGSRVVLDGTGLSAMVNSDGSYHFIDVPKGDFGLLIQPLGEDLVFSSAVKVGESDLELEELQATGFLLDDFDDGDSLPSLYTLGAGASWYVYRDGAGTTFAPTGVDLQITNAISTEGAFRGNSLGITVSLDSNVLDAYGSLACKIGNNGGTGRADLSKLDSVSLWLKGSGQIRIAFASDSIHVNYPASQAYADLGYTLQIPNEWTRISIPVDSLLPPENSEPWTDGVTWPDVAQAIDLFIIGTWDDSGQTVELNVDEIRFHGVSHTTFR